VLSNLQTQLALHPPKVREVLETVERALCSTQTHHTLIVVSGPPGVGKSALLHVLARRFATDAEIIHYTEDTPFSDEFLTFATTASSETMTTTTTTTTTSFFSASPLTPPSPRLSHFLQFLRMHNYPALPLTSSTTHSSILRPKLLLVEPLPSIHTTTQRQRLREALQQFLRGRASGMCRPVVLLCTLTETAADYSSSGLFLLGTELCENTTCLRLIRLRRVPRTRIYRQLGLILQAEGLSSHFTNLTLQRYHSPDPVLHHITLQADGDLRSAIHMLQWYCRRFHLNNNNNNNTSDSYNPNTSITK
jgi:predicted ATPase